MPRILVGATGSVACVKLQKLTAELAKLNTDREQVEVNVVLTENAKHFVNVDDLTVTVHGDADEWKWKKIGDPILHIELRKWADIFVIAPLDANTLAKMAGGLCDNLLTCVVRAWDQSKPLLFCPAMNTHMMRHPLTAQHIQILQGFGYEEIPAISKKLACGDEGVGAMANVSEIVKRVASRLGLSEPKSKHL